MPNDFGEGYCKCTPTLLPDKDGRAVLYADHVASTARLREALQAMLDYANSPDFDMRIGATRQARAALKETP